MVSGARFNHSNATPDKKPYIHLFNKILTDSHKHKHNRIAEYKNQSEEAYRSEDFYSINVLGDDEIWSKRECPRMRIFVCGYNSRLGCGYLGFRVGAEMVLVPKPHDPNKIQVTIDSKKLKNIKMRFLFY